MTKKPSQATVLIGLVQEDNLVELFHAPGDTAYARIDCGDHREIWPLRSGAFQRWLRRLYYLREGGSPGSQAIQDAIGTLEGIAVFGSLEHDTHLRVAAGDDGCLYLDLADERWHVVRIDRSGWEITQDPPVRFGRSSGMLSLPSPARGGSLTDLHPFLNVAGDDDFILIVSWLVGALHPLGPYVVLGLHGEQGSAKSTTARVLRSLIDPSAAMDSTEPREERDLVIAARNSWICSFDNSSHLPRWLSDALCRISTGSGFRTRALYTDDSEIIFSARRPVILNGVEELATRGDLLDRSIILSLPVIPDGRRRDEETFYRELEDARPRILGALLDAAVGALDHIDDTRLESAPRMADFAKWVSAAETALPWQKGRFLRAYAGNRAGAVQLTLEASAIYLPLKAIVETGFSGTASELLARLADLVGEDTTRRKDWPGAPNVLSGQLQRLAPALRRVGIEVTFDRTPAERRIDIRLHDGHDDADDRIPLDSRLDDGDDGDDDPSRLVSNGAPGIDVTRRDSVPCLLCGHPYFNGERGADEAACPACAASARGVITEAEAEELRKLSRFSVVQGVQR